MRVRSPFRWRGSSLHCAARAEIGGKDIVVLKLNEADGTMVWSRALGSQGDDMGRQLVRAGGGFGMVGSSLGYDALAVDHPHLTEDLLEENILMAHFEEGGYVQWARVYGGVGSEWGADVHYDEAVGHAVMLFRLGGVRQRRWVHGPPVHPDRSRWLGGVPVCGGDLGVVPDSYLRPHD